jgi:hypothetical protein
MKQKGVSPNWLYKLKETESFKVTQKHKKKEITTLIAAIS